MEGEYKNIFILNWLDWNGLNVTNSACLGLSNSNPPILSLCIYDISQFGGNKFSAGQPTNTVQCTVYVLS